ncbi:hypothetical protein KIPB_011469, partial [Kipferlia bialata]
CAATARDDQFYSRVVDSASTDLDKIAYDATNTAKASGSFGNPIYLAPMAQLDSQVMDFGDDDEEEDGMEMMDIVVMAVSGVAFLLAVVALIAACRKPAINVTSTSNPLGPTRTPVPV